MLFKVSGCSTTEIPYTQRELLAVILELRKGIEFLPQTQIFLSLYLGNLMVETLDISNLGYLI